MFNDAFAAALIGAALVASAVEEHKESLEQLATDIIISEYSDINEFRLKVIGLGGGGEAWSSDGKLSFVPLGLTIMKDGQLTDDKKLIVLLLSRGWVNEYGLDYTKITSELWEKEDWNIKNTIKTGITAIVSPAIIAPQSDVHSPLSFNRPIGKVLKSSEVNIISANKNSFQIQTVWKIAALAITGPDKGTIILKKI